MRKNIYALNFSAWNRFLLPTLIPDCRRYDVSAYTKDIEVIQELLRIPGPGLVVFHVNLTDCWRVLRDRTSLRHLLLDSGWSVINSNLNSISKRTIHRLSTSLGIASTVAQPEGSPDEELIVKTDRNHGGKPEAVLDDTTLQLIGIERQV
jgi:hypothetical protein